MMTCLDFIELDDFKQYLLLLEIGSVPHFFVHLNTRILSIYDGILLIQWQIYR